MYAAKKFTHNLKALGLKTEDFLSLSDLAKDSTYSQEYLCLLSRQQKLSAIKFGRNWLSSRKAVKEYIEKRKRKR
ncbi:MAG: hypothetical protein BBJ57_10805 [Desulfobacterales bacterium PC51MH44]|nr:MAG: hypothetical protein BBJ57_10805 [Desulfobacterales bacterium PC51MH44]